MENSPELQGLWKSVLDWVNKQFFQSGILHKRHAGPSRAVCGPPKEDLMAYFSS